MKVIFMGTPDFAAPTLKSLIASKNHDVLAVFTQRPKPKGRGYIESFSPIHDLALLHNISTYTPNSLRDLEVQNLINSIEADIIVVVAYGFIIPKAVLESKKYGCLNIHPSKLPRFRGAAPLQRSIIAGDKETAVCIMQMDEGLDTGDILMMRDVALDDKITFMQLYDICSEIGADLLLQTLDSLPSLVPTKQSDIGLVYAHKLTKEESFIDFSKTAFEVDCMIRGMNPWPGAYFEYSGEKIKILESEYSNEAHGYQPGYVVDDNLTIACSVGFLKIKKLQRAGKKALGVKEFLLGVKIQNGMTLTNSF
jgi:methionyl-tRNA formyltransferase